MPVGLSRPRHRGGLLITKGIVFSGGGCGAVPCSIAAHPLARFEAGNSHGWIRCLHPPASIVVQLGGFWALRREPPQTRGWGPSNGARQALDAYVPKKRPHGRTRSRTSGKPARHYLSLGSRLRGNDETILINRCLSDARRERRKLRRGRSAPLRCYSTQRRAAGAWAGSPTMIRNAAGSAPMADPQSSHGSDSPPPLPHSSAPDGRMRRCRV
jgi:hypothetical protein